jgi:hypothetical protein
MCKSSNRLFTQPEERGEGDGYHPCKNSVAL